LAAPLTRKYMVACPARCHFPEDRRRAIRQYTLIRLDVMQRRS
jgi:hypothetical protein